MPYRLSMVLVYALCLSFAITRQSVVAQSPQAAAMQDDFAAIYEAARPAVVAIARVRKDRVSVMQSLPFNQPRGLLAEDLRPWELIPTELGTGIALSENEVLTCWHLLDDPNMNDYWVWRPGLDSFSVQTTNKAVVRAGDPWSDLAVLRVQGGKFKALKWGNPQAAKIGHWAMVIACHEGALLGTPAGMSLGVISNLQQAAPRGPTKTDSIQSGRDSLHQYGTLFQLDLRTQQGISGGAVLNVRGEVIGLTTSLVSGIGKQAAAGYAIPLDDAARKAIETMRQGKLPEYGFLGVEPLDLDPSAQRTGLHGALIQHVVRGFPGDKAGLSAGQVVTAIDEVPLYGALDLFREISRRPAHQNVRLTVTNFDPRGANVPRELQAVLGKKNLQSRKASYALEKPPTWRGLAADWSTAIAPDRMLSQQLEQPPPVAIASVVSDSAAWRAGIRPGMLVIAVAGDAIASPADFFERVGGFANQPVTIRLIGDGGRLQTVEVAP